MVVDECLNATLPMIPVCFNSYGRDSAGNVLRGPVRIVELCDKVPKIEDYHDQCIIGALNVIIDFWGPDLEDQASQLCYILNDNDKEI